MLKKQLSLVEFVSMVAVLFALIAFSIDAMLPGLPVMANDLTPDAPNRIMFVILFFVFGIGVGVFFAGALADAFGRRIVVLLGLGVYLVGALIAYFAQSLEVLLAARLLQGLGASGPRIAVLAMVRDLYKGPEMARVMSLAMTIFMLMPAIAPLIGQQVILAAGWRSIFALFAAFSLVGGTWLALRQAETLTPENRRPLSLKSYIAASIELVNNRIVVISTVVQTLVMTFLFASISSISAIFDETYDRLDSLPLWFGGIALVAATSNVVNARMVVRLGMRKMITNAMIGHAAVAAACFVAMISLGDLPFWIFLIFVAANFFVIGFCMGNLTTLALEPMGHIAGMASSLTAGVSTIAATFLAAPISQSFDGTPAALILGVLLCSVGTVIMMFILGPRPLEETAS
jgi:DHA1 family bicyclomycin/chloramphenicol resistance-like MFS transporter